MNKPLAVGLIIIFVLVIAAGAIWLSIRPEAPELPAQERGILERFSGFFSGPAEEAAPAAGVMEPTAPEKAVLTLLSSEPVAGFAAIEKGVRFIERQTGHVYDIDSDGQNKTKISNTTIPKIFEAEDWSKDASSTILRYFADEGPRTVAVMFQANATQASSLPSNMISSAFAPDKNRAAYVLPRENGSRTVVVDMDGSKQAEINISPFRDWEISWPEKNMISYLSRPSGQSAGLLFKYDLQKKAFEKILGPLAGLEAKWSEDGQKIIYSSHDDDARKPNLFYYNLKTKEIKNLQIEAMASKCVFDQADKNAIYCAADPGMPQALYPDEWLNGSIALADIFWKINPESGEFKIINAEKSFDASQISVSKDGQFVYFIDKINNALWSLRVEELNR